MILHRLSGRGYATLKDIQLRLKSIQNIGKITKSMKMIASTKLNRAQKSMDTGRFYGQCALSFVHSLQLSKPALTEGSQTTDVAVPQIVVVCSSDRGLCGSIHSSLSKEAKRIVRKEKSADLAPKVVVIGDKAKPQVAREARNSIISSFSQVAKGNLSGGEAATVADLIIQSRADGESTHSVDPYWMRLLFNRFQSVISYATEALWLPPTKEIRESKVFSAYAEEEPMSEELLANYRDFALASAMYWALSEGHASEMASRRMAMENATKNSESIVQELTMRYNRTRQAVITNELVDIITGASAL